MNREIKISARYLSQFLVLVIILMGTMVSAQCPDANGSHNLKSQADVDAFLVNNPSCTYISELELSGDISDISGFSTLTSVDYLYIDDCPNLIGLTGFHNIDTIFENLGFYDTEGFSDLCGLNNLKFIGNDLRLEGTKSIENLNGLENLIFIGDNISIEENEKLESLNGLQNASLVDGVSINILDNPVLANCCGLQNIFSNTADLDVTIVNTPSLCSSIEDIINADCEFPVTDCITNTSEELAINIKVYPNPASNYLKIDNYESQKIDQLLLYNSFGQRVIKVENPSSSIPVDLLANGIYVVEIRIGERTLSDKIIIEK